MVIITLLYGCGMWCVVCGAWWVWCGVCVCVDGMSYTFVECMCMCVCVCVYVCCAVVRVSVQDVMSGVILFVGMGE